MKNFRTSLKLVTDYVRRLILAIAIEEYAVHGKTLVSKDEDITPLKNELIKRIDAVDFIDTATFEKEDCFIWDTFFSSFNAIRENAEESFQNVLDLEFQNRIALIILEHMNKEDYWVYYPKSVYGLEIDDDLDYICENIEMAYMGTLVNKGLADGQKIWHDCPGNDTMLIEYAKALDWICSDNFSTMDYTFSCIGIVVLANGEKFAEVMNSLKERNII